MNSDYVTLENNFCLWGHLCHETLTNIINFELIH